jgi:ligand-binding sensor domain-containing protein
MRLLYLVLLIPFTLFAQPTRRTAEGWQELTISDGLSQGMIFDLAQDKQGFIWVATKDGLNRYDGHNFTVFTHEPHNACLIPVASDFISFLSAIGPCPIRQIMRLTGSTKIPREIFG